MINWDEIDGLEGWRNTLKELLLQARDAAKGSDDEVRFEIHDLLMLFADKSPREIPETEALDKIAVQTAMALMTATVEERLQSITENTGAYYQLAKTFEARAEEDSAKADSIRLRAVTSFIDSTTKTVEAARELQKALQDKGADVKLGEKIQATIDAIEELRSSVGRRI